MQQLSILFPFSPAWVVARGGGLFVVGFVGVAPIGFAQWLQSSGCVFVGCAPIPAWRSFGEGLAVCLRAPSSVGSVLSGFSSGAGGSSHPSNSLPW